MIFIIYIKSTLLLFLSPKQNNIIHNAIIASPSTFDIPSLLLQSLKYLLGLQALCNRASFIISGDYEVDLTQRTRIESIPPLSKRSFELFLQIIDYLSFFDKKALAGTSKRCNYAIGPIKCPDRLSWMVHLCIIRRLPVYERMFKDPWSTWGRIGEFRHTDHMFQRRLKVLMRDSINSELRTVDEHYTTFYTQSHGLSARTGLSWWQHTNPISQAGQSSDTYEPLLEVYFPGVGYPESTLAHFHFAQLLDCCKNFSPSHIWKHRARGLKGRLRALRNLERGRTSQD